MINRLKITALAVIFAFSLSAFPSAAQESGKEDIIASTSWVKAFLLTAGVEGERIKVLAPSDILHPPEYELKPSDIKSLREADYIVYAGYEKMADKLMETADNSALKGIKIMTVNNIPTIEKSVSILAGIFRTEDKAQKNINEIKYFYSSWKNEIESAGLYSGKTAVNQFLIPYAKELGFNPDMVLPPGRLEAKQIIEIRNLKPLIVFDNYHNSNREMFEKIDEIKHITTWINFPEVISGDEDILYILKKNRDMFFSSLNQ